MIDFRQLIDVGLHFGHQKSRWCPKMKPYIWGHRGGVHLIDISKTAYALQKTGSFLESVVARGETVLWVGTKKTAKDTIAQVGQATGMPYVDYRWVGGTITNYNQVKKAVTKLLHFEDVIERSTKENSPYTKKEVVRFQKLAERLRRSVGGLKALTPNIGAIVLIDVRKEQTALLEAAASGVPVVALVDTNSDPSGVQYVIPGNDDSAKGIAFVLNYLQESVQKGLAKKAETMKNAKNAIEAQRAAAKDAAEPKSFEAKKAELRDIIIDTSDDGEDEIAPKKAVVKAAFKRPARKSV
ncbi:MAG TPA: 30S ribosomal protein S2 [Candidatus Saccharimonadales bacterium]|nr:30S ribosomal protein S2 [Candidatus Saccharimonadales bacterium]